MSTAATTEARETLGRLQTGDLAPGFDAQTIDGRDMRLSDFRGRKLLLSFFRYAACPLCNLRMHELSQRHERWQNEGLDMIAFFQSPSDSVDKRVQRKEFCPIVADPDHEVYQAYRIESSLAAFAVALVHPRSVSALVHGFMPGKLEGDKLLVPANFLINPDGTIHTAYYGKNITDHLSFDDIEAFIHPAS